MAEQQRDEITSRRNGRLALALVGIFFGMVPAFRAARPKGGQLDTV